MSDSNESGESVQSCKVCGVSTTNKCSSCKSVSYCSKDHQKEDWKNHRDACRPFEIKSTPELGRFLEATRRIPSGDVIFTELPIVVGPRPEDFVCLGCYSPEPQERCPQCFWPACSATCDGLTNPDHHGSECVIFRLYTKRVQYLTPDFFRFDAIFPLRCLLLQRTNPKKWKTLLEMESHMKKRGPNTEAYQQSQKIVDYLTDNFFKVLAQVEESSEAKLLPDRSPETIQKILGIIDVNALEIRLPNQTSINGLYPTGYLMEHNCLPNTRHVFQCHPSKFFKIIVLANQDVQPGNHISTMYTHALWGTQQRQDHLRSTKYFTCKCRRCGDPTELGTFLSALRCLAPGTDKKICGGSQLPVSPLDLQTEWRCDKCPTSLTSNQVADLVNMIGGEVDHVQENQPTVESLQSLLEKLRKLLHKNHYHCYAVVHSLIQLYGRQPGYLPDQMNDLLLQKKMKMCKELLATTSALDPTASRLALYSSVIEQELATATMTLAKRKVWTGDQLAEKLKEVQTTLNHGKKSLEPEEIDSPGGKILQVINNTILELEAFAKISGITL